jgi:hypothetical protein
VSTVEQRVETIELALGRFIMENGRALTRLENLIEESNKMADTDRERAETDRQRAEADRQRAEADRQRAVIDRQRAVIDREQAQADRQQSALERKEWNKKWGELANKLGTIVEDIVAPNLPRIAREHFGCRELDDFMLRRQVRNKVHPGKRREFDIIAICGDQFIINETKSKASVEYIDAFVKALPQLGEYFPEHRGKKLIPVFSSLYMTDDLVNYLSKQGVYAMGMGGDTMDLFNADRLRNREPAIL